MSVCCPYRTQWENVNVDRAKERGQKKDHSAATDRETSTSSRINDPTLVQVGSRERRSS